MKKKLISSFAMVLCLMTSYTACSQNNKQNKQNIELSQQERQQLQQVASIIDTMSFKPVYYLDYNHAGCSIDVRVNDDYVAKSFTRTNNGGTATSVNASIMHSGKQKITIRITPPKGQELLMPDSASFDFSISYKDFAKAGGERPWVDVWELPDIVEIPEQGIPYLEIEAEFEAWVPYSIERWTNCIDLRNIPDIEQRVVAEFKRIRQLMVDRDYDPIKKMYLTKHKVLMFPFYQTVQQNENDWMGYTKSIAKASPKEWAEIEDYELVFYANGRLVTLESKKRKGYNSALLYLIPKEIDADGRKIKYTNVHNFYLHLGIKHGTNTLVSL